MLGLQVQESKFKSDNCINMQILITNNKRFQSLTVKSALLNHDAIYALHNNKSFSPVTFIKCLYSCKSKLINKNKDNNKFFNHVTLTKRLYSCRNKHISKNSKNCDSKSETPIVLPATSTKR